MRSFVPTLMLVTAIAAASLVAGCQNPSASSTAPAAKIYDVKGKVVALDAARKVVTLDHEDIPGLMKAMTMEFAVEDPKVLGGVAAGDAVQAKLKVEGGNYIVTGLEKR